MASTGNLVTITDSFTTEDEARAFLEGLRWPDGPVCPIAGLTEPYKITPKPGSKTRKGLYEVDETYVGGRVRVGSKRGKIDKPPVVALVERGGNVRAFPMPLVTEANLRQAIRDHVEPSSRVMTDGHYGYRNVGQEFAEHQSVSHHAHEWVRGEAHTQTVEGFFSLLKRGINGTYHHVGEDHLHRYVDEFSFRWNHRYVTDGVRAAAAIQGGEGKRLMLNQPSAVSR